MSDPFFETLMPPCGIDIRPYAVGRNFIDRPPF